MQEGKCLLPKVSIVIPVYNGDNYLNKSIESALSQTYKNIEIIVVNDGSNDNGMTEKIAKSYGEKIQYYYKNNGGVSSALNYGIKKMTGEYFSWLSHDDLYSPTKIEDAINLLKQNSLIRKKTIVFTGGDYINNQGEIIHPFKKVFEKQYLYSGAEVVDVMTKKGTLNGCCMLIPKFAFDEVGFFNEDLRYSQDSLMWFSIFLKDYSLISDNKKNVFNRIHNRQVSQTRKDLFEHDSLVLAKTLVEPLAKLDTQILYQYIKRMTKYQCHAAVKYMIGYANNKELFVFNKRIKLSLLIIWGKLRSRLVKLYKNLLLFGR